MNNEECHPSGGLICARMAFFARPACDHSQIAESNSTDRAVCLTKEGSIYGDIKLLLG
jgi:hypothetical protein